MRSVATRVADERKRQITVEGFDREHDRGRAQELAEAGAAYAVHAAQPGSSWGAALWPWPAKDWNPGDDPVRTLVKAAALLVAAAEALEADGPATPAATNAGVAHTPPPSDEEIAGGATPDPEAEARAERETEGWAAGEARDRARDVEP